jgi:WD40 repeat protein
MPSVFLSYSHKDEAWKDRLQTHLGVFEPQGLDTWSDRRIEGGADWFEDIQVAMARASVAVLLISADFLTSKFILGKEVPKLLERRSREGVTVFPVIIRSCAWDEISWLNSIQARPKDGKALASFEGDGIDQELTKIAKEIRALLRQKEEARDRPHDRELRRGDDFLDRVEAVCRLREPDAEIRRFPGIGEAGGYLRVIRRVGSFVREIFPIGVVEQGLSRKAFEAFLAEIDEPYRKVDDKQLISHLVYGGPPAPADLVAEAIKKRVNLLSFIEHQGLIDFRSYLVKQTQKLAADPIYPPSLYVPQRMRTLSILGREEDATADALAQVREWLDSPLGRFIVLLGDFGTGKTFLLHELARRMGESEDGLVPILLQMRSLEKGRALDELLAQHFAREGMEGFSPAKFRYMLEQGRIALLFDGFDELALRVTYAKAAEHFSTLLQAAAGNAKVVLTSRRQHFLTENDVKTALAQQIETITGRRLAILQPFDRDQIQRFLLHFFQGDAAKAEARLDLIDRVKDLLGLSANPRLLGFIAELPEEQLTAACAKGGEITAAKLYELLLNRWLVDEFNRVHPKGAPPGLSVEERWQAVTLVAMRLWQKTDRFVSVSDLSEETARVVKAVGPTALDSEVAAFQVGSGTLLVRDEEGNFAFLHQSILEWLVARSAAEADPEVLASREVSPLMADFFADLAGKERAVAWARGVLSSPAGEAAKKNALLVLERQKEEVRETLDLSGQDLRGKDFSGQDLSAADLSGADLSDAQLIGTRLDRARLAKAILRNADLSRADLTLADLADADLTGARLLGADLRDTHCQGARLRRAKLLDTTVRLKTSFDAADVFGVAWNICELEPKNSRTAEGCQAIAWSPDGDMLASADGSVIWLWDTQSGREIRNLAGHQSTIRSLVFSPGGESLASGSDDKTIRLWQLESGREIRTFAGNQNSVRSLAFSPDGMSLASGSDDYTVRLWRVDTGQDIKVFIGHRKPVLSLFFSPDGESLASVSSDNTLRIWEVSSGKFRAFMGDQRSILSAAFSSDYKRLARGFHDGTVHLFQVDSGREIRTFKANQHVIRIMAFSPDGKILAVGSDDGTVRLWHVDSEHEIRVFIERQEFITSVAFSPDGKSLASSSRENTLNLWQVDSGRKIRAFQGQENSVRNVVFSPDGRSLAACNNAVPGAVYLWQVDSGCIIREFNGHHDTVTSVAFSPDGKSLVSGSSDRTVRFWQVDNGHEIRVFSGNQKRITSVAFSPDGKSFASGSDDKFVRLRQLDGGREIRVFTEHQNTVRNLAFSPDGEILASCSSDKIIRLWQVESGHEIRVFRGNGASSIAFSPDGKRLASGSAANSISLWQVDNGCQIRTFTGHHNTVLSVAFSADGKSLASGSSDQTVRLWQVDSGREIRAFQGHQRGVWSVAFSPDGKSLASGSSDGTIRLWDVASGLCLAVLLSLPEGWVSYSPDGRYKFGGVPAGGFWHVVSLCRFEIGELDEWVPGLRLADEASFFDLPPWKPEVRLPEPAR